jgi:hypothetical protein
VLSSAITLPLALRQVNTNNITSFDSEEDFMQAMSDVPSDASAEAKDVSAEDQMGEEGEIDVHDYSLPRHLPDQQAGRQPSSDWNYKLYKTFWNLQSYFSADTKALDTTEKWSSLQESLTEVFALLQAHGSDKEGDSSSGSIDQSNSEAIAEDNATMKTYFGCKFLTSAKVSDLLCHPLRLIMIADDNRM